MEGLQLNHKIESGAQLNKRALAANSVMALVIVAAVSLTSKAANAQVLVATGNQISEYSTDGATLNAPFITAAHGVTAMAVSGSDLYLLENDGNGIGSIQEYTTSGILVNPLLVAGIQYPQSIAVSGSDLFVSDFVGTVIAKYSTSGAVLNANLISGGNYYGIVTDGSHIFTASGGTIGEYTTTGDTINESFVTGLDGAFAIAISGSDLFVTNSGFETIGEYTTSGDTVSTQLISTVGTGPYLEGVAAWGSDVFFTNDVPFANIHPTFSTLGKYDGAIDDLNLTLVTGLNNPGAVAVIVPEPATASLLLLAGAGMLIRRRRTESP
jgi:hypothetical protein